MAKCRTCLSVQRNLTSIFTFNGEKTLVDMLRSITNVKISKDDGLPDQICQVCRKKLLDAYDFKLLVERSDWTLLEHENMKKIYFSNIHDIKIKIEITDIENQCLIQKSENFPVWDSLGPVHYNDTTIKKLTENKTPKENVENKPLSVLDFLKRIKVEPEVSSSEFQVDEYGQEFDSDEDFIVNEIKRKKKSKKKSKKAVKNNICSIDLTKNPIRPIYLDDVKLVRAHTAIKKKSQTDGFCHRKKRRKESICPYCGKITKCDMKNHILQHIGERKYKCEICLKGFFTSSALNLHKRRHFEKKKYKCDLCIATFYDNKALISHQMCHSDVKSHVCDICSKAFKRKSALRRHVVTHNFLNKRVNCNLCPMTFHTNFALKNHMRVHTGERPYMCEICNQSYSYKHDFNRHCFKKHGVFLKRRSVYIMNEEVLQRERTLMRELMLQTNGFIKTEKIINPFEGPQAAQAFEQTIKVLEERQVPIDL